MKYNSLISYSLKNIMHFLFLKHLSFKLTHLKEAEEKAPAVIPAVAMKEEEAPAATSTVTQAMIPAATDTPTI